VPFFLLFALLFTAVAVYITVGRFIVDIWLRARTAYAVTDQRVIIASGLLSQTVKSLSLQTLTDVTLTERADGTGTITFGPTNPWGAMSGGMRWPGVPQQPMFERIPGAREVYDMIRDAQTKASRNPA
jgi:Bacterial PH domain